VPGTRSALVVPLRRKGKTLGALNLQSHTPAQFTQTDEAVLRQFAAAVAVAIENARLFEQEKQYAETLETLAHIGREVASILDLDELLTAIAQHVRCVISYRTFGILLLNAQTSELEMKLAVKYGEHASPPTVKLGEGLCGYAALHKQPCSSGFSSDPRYIGAGRRAISCDPHARAGPLHRRLRSREPGARRLQQARRGDPHPAGEPGGGGDRERALTRRSAPTRYGWRTS
jgi:GAF domain-containing protein